ncbi:hypothetical protein LOTGIDRAFT_237979 [Lottia gigantea]|uniref:SIS domain-containing protein n=1 Tax=Lottia gigantea TaxID=225164 RepID=V4CJU5_LOTGI|nr:hypothetical protein LOTGIDRAFT_237979 [Lottia gigantea]ESP02485.1 hypothetical protein LOTGIDRAFT_237979 [Lottia gigantea]
MTPEKPITELINPKSNNIDVANPLEIVEILEDCDSEIFKGWQSYPNLYSERIQRNLDNIVEITVNILKNSSKNSIILSGCGTSGRLAFLIARTFNEKLKKLGLTPCCDYLIAGGDIALFTSQESGEDDPINGKDLLIKAGKGKKKVLFIGITCGLSAPFVAGQLDYCMQRLDKFIPVVIGFNPSALARNIIIENWHKTFLNVMEELLSLEGSKKGFIINPVVGPEPITGSSRMKSGTATKLILESIFIAALSRITGQKIIAQLILNSYETVYNDLYSEKQKISKVVKLAGESLKSGGSIYYIGYDSLGIMGMIDASECRPTYGASLDDVRGFLSNGFKNLRNKDGSLSHVGKHFRISIEEFNSDILPYLKSEDLVVLLVKDNEYLPDSNLMSKSCKKVLFVVNDKHDGMLPSNQDVFIHIKVTINSSEIIQLISKPIYEEYKQVYLELATKWFLNSLSTGAHIMKGKVYQNIMIDLKPSNNKLFHRAIHILQNFNGLTAEECIEYLLRSIYEADVLNEDQLTSPIASHIQVAATKNMVIPTALAASLIKCSIKEAKEKIDEEPVLRTVFLQTLKFAKSKYFFAQICENYKPKSIKMYPINYLKVLTKTNPAKKALRYPYTHDLLSKHGKL